MRSSVTALLQTIFLVVFVFLSSVDARMSRHPKRCVIKPSGSPNVLANQVSTTNSSSATKAKSSTTSTRRTVTTTVLVTAAATTTSSSSSSSKSKSKPKPTTTTTTTTDNPAPSNNDNGDRTDDGGDNGDSGDQTDNNAQTYKVQDRFAGDNFFDGFGFDSFADPTHGNVNYLQSSDAFNRGLAYVDDNGLAVMKVDNTNTVAAGGNRDSVRISSKNAYSSGLIVLDVDSMPYGCGVWPAFWTVGDNWPNGGEIDILEGVNNANHAQYTLHTAPGCQLDTTFTKASTKKHRHRSLVHSIMANERVARDNSNGVSPLAFTGTVLTSNCDATINSNTGCGIRDTNPNSYGSALNANGGGVFATLLDSNGVAVWFFPRDSIPDDLASQSPQPSTWSSPKAFWSSSMCPTKSFFGPQRIVINTTLCGDWAGSAYSGDGCPGTCADRVADPKNFNTAQWKIRSVTVYQQS